MVIKLSEIKPYVRYIRYNEVSPASDYVPSVPIDARLFFTVRGEGEIVADGRAYRMGKSSLIIINSGVEYHLRPSNTGAKYLGVNFDYTFAGFEQKHPIPPTPAREYDRTLQLDGVTFADVAVLDRVLYVPHIPSVEGLLTSMEREYSLKEDMYELKLCADMTNILVLCLRSVEHETCDKSTVTEIISYIREDLKRDLSNLKIARRFHYHPNYVSHLIKEYTGMPLHSYVNAERAALAAELLATTDCTITEVAERCGYYDSSHLIKSFKKVTGVTPIEYREGFR